MELPKPIPIGVFNRSDNPHWDNLFLPDDGVNIIMLGKPMIEITGHPK
jgi:hypothetical protein